MRRKLRILDLDAYAHLFKDGRAGLQIFVDALEQMKKADPDGIVHVMNGNEHICGITFKIPKWAYKLLPKHRPIDAEWTAQFDEPNENE